MFGTVVTAEANLGFGSTQDGAGAEAAASSGAVKAVGKRGAIMENTPLRLAAAPTPDPVVAAQSPKVGPLLPDGSFEKLSLRDLAGAAKVESSPNESKQVTLLKQLLETGIIDDKEYQTRLAQVTPNVSVIERSDSGEEETPPVPEFPGVEAFGLSQQELAGDEEDEVDEEFDAILNRSIQMLSPAGSDPVREKGTKPGDGKEPAAASVAVTSRVPEKIKVPLSRETVSAMPEVKKANVVQCPGCSVIIPQNIGIRMAFCPNCGRRLA